MTSTIPHASIEANEAGNPRLLAALDYLDRGWFPIPLHHVVNGVCSCRLREKCGSPGKHPRPRKLPSEPPDEKTVRDWFQRWPQANLAILLGASGLLGVDCDPRNGADQSLAKLVEQVGPLTTYRVRTGGGGWHLYFNSPGVPVTARRLGPGLELKSAHQHQLVCPPSVHASGKPYVYVGGEVEDVPPALLDLIRGPKPRVKPVAPSSTFDGRIKPYAKAAVDGEVHRVQTSKDGERNHNLYVAAASLFGLVAGGELPADMVEHALTVAALSVGLTEREARKTIASGRKRGMDNPRAVPERAPGGVDQAIARMRSEAEAAHWPGASGPRNQALMLAGLRIAQEKGRLHDLGMSVRELSEETLYSLSTASIGVRELVDAGWWTRLGTAKQKRLANRNGRSARFNINACPNPNSRTYQEESSSPFFLEEYDCSTLRAVDHPVWTYRGLGAKRRLVYALLHAAFPAEEEVVGKALGVKVENGKSRQARRHLDVLASKGLAVQTSEGGWLRGPANLDDVAHELALDDLRVDLERRYAKDRAAHAVWIENFSEVKKCFEDDRPWHVIEAGEPDADEEGEPWPWEEVA